MITHSNVNLAPVTDSLRQSIVALNQSGQDELARLVEALFEKIPGSAGLSEDEKSQALELTGTVVSEIRKYGRITAAVKRLAPVLGELLSRSAELAAIWQALQPFITR